MSTVSLENYLIVGAIVFVLGIVGFVARRNIIVMFLSVEMMLQGVAINMVAFARYHGNVQGQAFVLFMLAVAACEAAVALALIVVLYRQRETLDVSVWQDLREPDQEPILDEEEPVQQPKQEPLPRLTPAGREPEHEESFYVQ